MRLLRRFLAALLTGYGWYEREISGARHPVATPAPCRHPVRIGPHCADCGEKVL